MELVVSGFIRGSLGVSLERFLRLIHPPFGGFDFFER
jgi:hypothetical protein